MRRAADGRASGLLISAALLVKHLSTMALPAGALLAGKGAWTRDGKALAVVVPKKPNTPIPQHWRVDLLDATTGRSLPTPALPVVTNAMVIRAVGWQPNGRLLVVAYRAERNAAPKDLGDRTSFHDVRRADLLALAPGAAEPTVLLKPPWQHLAMDVADNAISSGLTFHNPNQPWIYVSRTAKWTITAIAGVPLALILVTLLLRHRRRRPTRLPLARQPVSS